MRERDFPLARKMQIDAALADADFAGDVVNRHFPVSVSFEQPVGSVQNRFFYFFGSGDIRHNF